jgi:predicted metal-dependent hydrolase
VVPLLTLLPDPMNDNQRTAMIHDLIHAVKVAMYHHQQSGNVAARNALFEEWQEWIVDGPREVELMDSILPA